MTWIGALEGGVTYIIGWASEKSAEAKTIRRILAWGDSLFLSRKPTDWRRFPTVTLWIGDPPLRRATQAFPIGPMFEESFLWESPSRSRSLAGDALEVAELKVTVSLSEEGADGQRLPALSFLR